MSANARMMQQQQLPGQGMPQPAASCQPQTAQGMSGITMQHILKQHQHLLSGAGSDVTKNPMAGECIISAFFLNN